MDAQTYDFNSLPHLFDEVKSAAINDSPDDVDILRYREGILNDDVLRGARRAGVGIAFNLFEDVSLVGVVDYHEEIDKSVILSGNIDGLEGRSFVIVEHTGVVTAHIQGMNSDFEVRPSSEGGYLIQEIDPTIKNDCGVEAKHMVEPPRGDALKHLKTFIEDGSRVDSLVIYTAGALEEAGNSVPTLEGIIRNAERWMNIIFQNSQIDLILRIVGIVQVNFQESYSYGTDLDRIIASSTIKNLRDEYKADQVTLIRLPGSHHGIAYRTGGTSLWSRNHSYSVVSDRRIVRGYVFAHEFGHNLGCAHNRAHVDAVGIFEYSYGQWFYGNSGKLWGTIMSYPGERIPNFSNPNVMHDGVPTGHATLRDNARTIRETKRNVANYRQSSSLFVSETQTHQEESAVAAAQLDTEPNS